MNRDTVVGIVGSGLLVAAMVLVFAYERANAEAAGGTDLEPSISEASLSGSVALGASDTKTTNITASGPTNVTFTLTWTAGDGSDTLRLTVMPPMGSEGISAPASQAEDDGSITVTVAIPEGSSTDGNWTVKVDFTAAEADSLPGGISPPVGGMTDDSVEYKVAIAFA